MIRAEKRSAICFLAHFSTVCGITCPLLEPSTGSEVYPKKHLRAEFFCYNFGSPLDECTKIQKYPTNGIFAKNEIWVIQINKAAVGIEENCRRKSWKSAAESTKLYICIWESEEIKCSFLVKVLAAACKLINAKYEICMVE